MMDQSMKDRGGKILDFDKWDNRYLSLAKEVSTWSKDPSTQVGAVAVNNMGNVVAQGYNGLPRGIKDTKERYSNRELKYEMIVHAEANCIYNAAYNGNSLDGCTMYVWPLPVCHECCKAIIQSGVWRVVSPKFTDPATELRWKESCEKTIKLFREAGVEYDFI